MILAFSLKYIAMKSKLTRRQFLGSAIGITLASYSGFELSRWLDNPSGSADSFVSSGVTWSNGKLLPSFSDATSLDVATIIGLSEEEQLLFVSLQGLVNKDNPSIYLLEEDEEGRLTWLEELGIPYRFLSSPWELFNIHRSVATGLVVYDPNLIDTVNIATTRASIASELIVSPDLLSAVSKATGLLQRETYVNRFNSKTEAYQFALEELWQSCQHRILCGIAPFYPTGNPAVLGVSEFGSFDEASINNVGPISPNSFLRDYAIATNSFVFRLNTLDENERLLAQKILSLADKGAVYMGWFDEGSSGGESSGVSLTSSESVRVITSDSAVNMSVLSAIRASTPVQASNTSATLANKIYLTFTFTEGDNLQYMEHHMRVIWDDPQRGLTPCNWTIDPVAVDIAPTIISHYFSTKTTNDYFVCGPSGAGYMYPSLWPEVEISTYLNQTLSYCSQLGIEVYNVLNHPQGSPIPIPSPAASAYESILNPIGVLFDWNTSESVSILGSNLPASIGILVSSQTELSDTLSNITSNYSGNGPVFHSVGLSSWTMSPTILNTTLANFSANIEVVSADSYFVLLREHLGLSKWV